MNMTNNICNIKVIGVGGGGGNAVNRMVEAGITSAYFVAVNTDVQDLMTSKADETIQIGPEITRGLGVGSNPDLGHAAAEESKEAIVRMLQGTDLVFITAGLGGGTGTGAAPVIAKIAKNMGILTVGVVTKPFGFEGPVRSKNAQKGLDELRENVDTLVIVPNEKLNKIFKKISFEDAFIYADDALRQAIQGVSELIVNPGLINLDFADVRTIMKDKGLAHMGIGVGKGANKTLEAVRQAVTSQLLETSIEGATGILINIAGGKDLTLGEIYEAVDLVRDVADDDCNIIFGATINNNITGETAITVIATGFDLKNQTDSGIEKMPEFKENSANFRPFTAEPEVQSVPVQPEPEEERIEEKVEDITYARSKPVVDDDDIPPFLRKLRK